MVVNAEDPLCLDSLNKAGTRRHILVSMKADVHAVQLHLEQKNGEAIYISKLEGQREFTSSLRSSGQRVLLNLSIGNRHQAHLEELAPILAKKFDRFILGCDANFVKQSADYVGADPEGQMLEVSQAVLLKAGVAAEAMVTEHGYRSAILLALQTANPGDLLVLLAEPWEVLSILKEMRESVKKTD